MAEVHVELQRKNEETLEGFVMGEGEKLALHVHGSYGNYFENPFVKELASIYNDAGYAYASTNNPGHDDKTSHENFADSYEAIDAWINELAPGDSSIILQGHSLGALKILALATQEQRMDFMKRVEGIVLLSPFDVVAFYGGENIIRRRDHAKEFRDEQGERAILPDSIFDTWPISAGTFLELSEQGGDYDLFPTREKRTGLLTKIKVPVLTVIGGADIASYPSPEAVRDLLDTNGCNYAFIEGAPHNFAGYEDKLCDVVADFVRAM